MENFLTPQEIAETITNYTRAISDTSITTGALNRQDLQSDIVVAAPIQTPLRNRLNRVPGNGTAHSFYRLKPNADVSQGVFLGTTPGNAVFSNGGLPTDNVELYDLVAIPYANLGDIARVTFQDRAQGRSFTDLMAQRRKVKMFNVGMMEEYFILNGDSSVTQPGGGVIFDGIIKQIENGGGNIVPATGGRLDIGTIRTLAQQVWQAGGVPTCAVMDSLEKAILTAQVNQIYGLRNDGALTGIGAGISVEAYDFGFGKVDWITSRYLTPAYGGVRRFLLLDDKTTDGKNDGCVIDMVDVDPLNSIELALVQTEWRELIWETTSLRVSAPSFQGEINGITLAGQSPVTG